MGDLTMFFFHLEILSLVSNISYHYLPFAVSVVTFILNTFFCYITLHFMNFLCLSMLPSIILLVCCLPHTQYIRDLGKM